jgi:hypothetical protein
VAASFQLAGKSCGKKKNLPPQKMSEAPAGEKRGPAAELRKQIATTMPRWTRRNGV